MGRPSATPISMTWPAPRALWPGARHVASGSGYVWRRSLTVYEVHAGSIPVRTATTVLWRSQMLVLPRTALSWQKRPPPQRGFDSHPPYRRKEKRHEVVLASLSMSPARNRMVPRSSALSLVTGHLQVKCCGDTSVCLTEIAGSIPATCSMSHGPRALSKGRAPSWPPSPRPMAFPPARVIRRP